MGRSGANKDATDYDELGLMKGRGVRGGDGDDGKVVVDDDDGSRSLLSSDLEFYLPASSSQSKTNAPQRRPTDNAADDVAATNRLVAS